MELRSAAARAAAPPAAPRPAAVLEARSRIVAERAAATASGDGVPAPDEKVWEDVRRICALPVEAPFAPEEVEHFSRAYSIQSAFERGCGDAACIACAPRDGRSGFRLWEPQARALEAYQRVGGLLAPIAVGGGKTLVALSIAHLAYGAGLRRILVMLPAETMGSFHLQVPWIRAHVPLSVPLHKVEGSQARRGRLAASKMPGCYAMPYSLLSTNDAEDLLAGIEPDLIVCDEVHRLKHLNSGRTRRVRRYLEESRGACRFVGMSGTITSRSLMDYWHLIKWALRDRAPVPMGYYSAASLAAVLDSDAAPSDRQLSDWGPLQYWAGVWFPGEQFPSDVAGLRRAYQYRFNSAPGVVRGGDDGLECQLIVRNRPAPAAGDDAGWLETKRLIREVTDYLTAPNGEPIDHAIHTHKWLRELTVGFYHEQVWPTPEQLAKTRNIDESDAAELLRRAVAHNDALCSYHADLRRWFSSHDLSGLDTPQQVGKEMALHGAARVGEALYHSWRAAKDQEFADMPVRYGRPVRVCDYKIRAAVEWMRRERRGVVWYYHREVGAWLLERARAAGLDPIHCPAEVRPVEHGDEPVKVRAAAARLHLCSMAAHGTGKNLQHHDRQLFVEWPRASGLAQQVLGRLRRPGQAAKVLHADCLDTTDYDAQARAAGLVDALYHSQSMGVPQMVVYCGYDPLPTYFPPQVLRERGFQNRLLTEYQTLLLREIHGESPDGVDEGEGLE